MRNEIHSIQLFFILSLLIRALFVFCSAFEMEVFETTSTVASVQTIFARLYELIVPSK